MSRAIIIIRRWCVSYGNLIDPRHPFCVFFISATYEWSEYVQSYITEWINFTDISKECDGRSYSNRQKLCKYKVAVSHGFRQASGYSIHICRIMLYTGNVQNPWRLWVRQKKSPTLLTTMKLSHECFSQLYILREENRLYSIKNNSYSCRIECFMNPMDEVSRMRPWI